MAFRSSAYPPEITVTARIVQLLNLPLRMIPLIVAIGTLPWRHGEKGTWCTMGVLVSIWISRYLKILINQPRPTSALGLRADPGMPSSHAQCFLYITTYGALTLIDSQGLHLSTFGLGVLIISFGAFVAWTRILEGVHTYAQAMEEQDDLSRIYEAREREDEEKGIEMVETVGA
ncbi:hypothetical protein SUGI_0342040 [Cryptomeria japonica]|nr:hypothetical protein SUGI_0342040 [Cryptomeria japonica]